MSSGTNNERVIQNNNLLEENNIDLNEIKELANSLPDKFNDIIYNTDGMFSNPVEDEIKTYTASKTLYPQEVKVSDIIFIKNITSESTANQIIACKVLSVKEVEYLEEDCYELQLKILKVFNTVYDTKGSTATANDILYGKSAYSNGSKIEGNIRDTYFDNTLDDSMITIRNTTIGPSEQKSPATQFYIPNLNNSEPKQLFKSISANVLNSRLASHIALTPEKLKKDETVLGIVGTFEGGTDTSDANATTNDIANSKTAYVKGQKITGNLLTIVGFTGSQVLVKEELVNEYGSENSIEYDNNYNLLTLAYKHNRDELLRTDSITSIDVPASLLASEINLTPDVIKKDVTIMNITGTYEGSSEGMKEYSTIALMKADIENISEGELVKVTSSSTPRYFIKRTTMIELVIPETQEYYDVYWE